MLVQAALRTLAEDNRTIGDRRVRPAIRFVMLKVKLGANVSIGRDALYALPPELIALLRSIRQHGSLMQAAREVGTSYRHAWSLLGRWEAITGHKLAILTRGQGTGLTPFGARFAEIGEWLDARIDSHFADLGDELARHLNLRSESGDQRVQLHASHDVALLKLKERLDRHLAIDLRFGGGLDSLDSLARGDCDVAGFHLPVPPTLLGSLREEFDARLDSRQHYVGRLLSRQQGLMIARANLRRVRGVADLARLRIRFVNRERGSGTRLLLDALLERDGVAPAQINGYEHEEFTHMATAAIVRAGMADAAFGNEAAARAHNLAFVGIVTEHYYLACMRNTPARIALDTMIAAARSTAFARAVARIGGYDTTTAKAPVALNEVLGRRPRA
jgi:putative molybdopterin biosynthesis protein